MKTPYLSSFPALPSIIGDMVNNVHDPYFELLAIPPSEQPPTLYQLLGVPRFTENKSVITNAASQRMQFLRRVGGEKYLNDVQRILNEIVEAKILLMDDDRRLVYDQDLRSIEEQLEEQRRQLAEARRKQNEEVDSLIEDVAKQESGSTQAHSVPIEPREPSGEPPQQTAPSSSEVDEYRLADPDASLQKKETKREPPGNSEDYYRVRDYVGEPVDEDERRRVAGYYRDPSLRPLRKWDDSDEPLAVVLNRTAPPKPSFPSRQEAAEKKAAEVREKLAEAAEKEKKVIFTEPRREAASKPAIALFLNGNLAGTAIQLSNRKNFFRLRRNGMIVPVEGKSSHKPNFAFQESHSGWECRAIRTVVINGKLCQKAGKLNSGDIVRLSLDGPNLLWLDQGERLPETQVIQPQEITAHSLMNGEAMRNAESVSRVAERDETRIRGKKQQMDLDVLVRRLIWGSIASLAAYVIIRQLFFT